MNDVSKEYSEALFSLAAEESREKEYAEALAVLKGLISENPKFIELLSSPCVSLSERKNVIDTVFNGGDEIETNLASFMKVLCEKGHVGEILDIIDETTKMLKAAEGVSTAYVTSAIELSDAERSALAGKLAKKLGHRVELVCDVDKSLLGGVIVKVDGNIIDGSLRYKLQNIKEIIS